MLADDRGINSNADGSGGWTGVGDVNFANVLRVGKVTATPATLRRGAIKFEVTLASNEIITAATLQATLQSQTNAVSTHTVSVWHSLSDDTNSAGNSTFEDATYSDTGSDLISGMGKLGQVYSADVTSALLAEFPSGEAAGPTVVSFRLQLDDDLSIDSSNTTQPNYRFWDSSDDSIKQPQLLLTTQIIPEPGAVGLVGVAPMAIPPCLRARHSSSLQEKVPEIPSALTRRRGRH